MKNSLNLSTAELGCGNGPGLLQGKGTSINTAGAVQASPFGVCWSCEAVRTSSGWVVPRAGRHGESIPTTATRSVGELGADSVTAAMLHQSCRRSLKITWTSSACGSWVSPQVPVTDSGSCSLPGSQRTEFVPKCWFALA